MEAHNSCLYISATKVLVFLDCTRREGRDFLEDLVKSLQTNKELKKLLDALSKWISAFEDHVWELALSKELAEEEVAPPCESGSHGHLTHHRKLLQLGAGGSRGESWDQNP